MFKANEVVREAIVQQYGSADRYEKIQEIVAPLYEWHRENERRKEAYEKAYQHYKSLRKPEIDWKSLPPRQNAVA